MMTLAYRWEFPSLDVAPCEDGLSNVVKMVHWRLSATDGAHYAETYSTAVMAEPGEAFVEYEALTPQIVTGWVVATLGEDAVAEMQVNLAAEIARKANPPVVELPPPWLPETET